MRGTVHNAIVGARGIIDNVMADIKKSNVRNDDELLAEYMKHRGKPEAMASFVLERAPAGSDPLAEMRRYEADMERRLKAQGGA